MEFLYFLSEHRNAFFNVFFQGITYLAQEIFIIAFICWFFWCGKKALAYRLGMTYFISGLGVQALKVTFRILRPWVLDPNFKPVSSAIEGASGYSFPSGHTQSATAFLGTLILYIKKYKFKLLCALGIGLVALSRLYLGVHTPKDVLTAFVIAAVCCCLVSLLFRKIENDTKYDPLISLLLLAASVLLLIYGWYLISSKQVPTSEAADAIKAAAAGVAFSISFFIERRYIKLTPPLTTHDKVIRFIIGLAVVAALEFGMKLIFHEDLIWTAIRYFLIVLWIMVVYPFLIMKLDSISK